MGREQLPRHGRSADRRRHLVDNGMGLVQAQITVARDAAYGAALPSWPPQREPCLCGHDALDDYMTGRSRPRLIRPSRSPLPTMMTILRLSLTDHSYPAKTWIFHPHLPRRGMTNAQTGLIPVTATALCRSSHAPAHLAPIGLCRDTYPHVGARHRCLHMSIRSLMSSAHFSPKTLMAYDDVPATATGTYVRTRLLTTRDMNISSRRCG